MATTRGIPAVYRHPQELEDCWQCPMSGALFVYPPPGPQDDRAARQPVTPRCPCHQRRMRRHTAPWHGCPAWVGRVLFTGISLYSLWTLLSAFCLVPGLHLVGPGC